MSKATLMAVLIGAAGFFVGNIAYNEYVKYRATPSGN